MLTHVASYVKRKWWFLLFVAVMLALNVWVWRLALMPVPPPLEAHVSLSTLLTLLFTAVTAGATVVYAHFSIKLWRATKESVDLTRDSLDVSRAKAANDLILNYANFVQANTASDPQGAEVAGKILIAMVEATVRTQLQGVDLTDPAAHAYFSSIIKPIADTGADVATLPIVGEIAKALSAAEVVPPHASSTSPAQPASADS